MAEKKRGLGRPLDAILGAAAMTDASANKFANINKPIVTKTKDAAVAQKTAEIELGQVSHLPVEFLQRGKYQPRRDIDPAALEELTESIRSQGIIQPILARKINDNRYEIIAGERRWRAAQLAGMTEVPVIIREFTDQAAMAVSLIENIQREDLNPIEEAMAFQRLLEEFKMTHQQVATAVGRSRAGVSNMLRLLSLQKQVRVFLERGDLEMGHARALLTLSEDEQRRAAEQVISNHLSVRETERLVKRFTDANDEIKIETKIAAPNIIAFQDRLSRSLGTKVIINKNDKGRGKISIKFTNEHQFNKLMTLLEQE